MTQGFGLLTGSVLGNRGTSSAVPVFRMPRPGFAGQPKLVRPFVVKITAHRLVRLPA